MYWRGMPEVEKDGAAHAESGRVDRPLRIGLFTDNYGPGRSGLMFAVQFLEGELLNAGHQVLLVAPASKGPNPHAGKPGRREIRLPSTYLIGTSARFADGRQFEEHLEELSADPPDLIHVHGFGAVGLLGVWVAKRAGVPLLVTWHTDFEAYADHYWHLAPFLDAFYRLIKLSTGNSSVSPSKLRHLTSWRSIQPPRTSRRNLLNGARQMLEDADVVVTPSEKTERRVAEFAPKCKVRTIPNGADKLPSEPGQPRARGRRLLYAGRIAPEKGIGLLLDAFRLVQEHLDDVELMIVGDWRKSPVLRQRLKRAAARGGVTLVGEVERDQLGGYYESADVFVFPSLTDTQALVLHEAAHAGLPIVTVDSELDLVIDPDVNSRVTWANPVSLGNGITAMLRDLDDPGFGERAAARSRELASKWSIANQSQTYMDLYAEMARAGRR